MKIATIAIPATVKVEQIARQKIGTGVTQNNDGLGRQICVRKQKIELMPMVKCCQYNPEILAKWYSIKYEGDDYCSGSRHSNWWHMILVCLGIWCKFLLRYCQRNSFGW